MSSVESKIETLKQRLRGRRPRVAVTGGSAYSKHRPTYDMVAEALDAVRPRAVIVETNEYGGEAYARQWAERHRISPYIVGGYRTVDERVRGMLDFHEVELLLVLPDGRQITARMIQEAKSRGIPVVYAYPPRAMYTACPT